MRRRPSKEYSTTKKLNCTASTSTMSRSRTFPWLIWSRLTPPNLMFMFPTLPADTRRKDSERPPAPSSRESPTLSWSTAETTERRTWPSPSWNKPSTSSPWSPIKTPSRPSSRPSPLLAPEKTPPELDREEQSRNLPSTFLLWEESTWPSTSSLLEPERPHSEISEIFLSAWLMSSLPVPMHPTPLMPSERRKKSRGLLNPIVKLICLIT